MKARIKEVIAVFVICLMLIPTVWIVAAENRINIQAQIALNKQVPKKLTVSPKEINVIKGTSEDIFKNLLEVSVTYKGTKQTEVVTNYETNYDEFKDTVGPHSVVIVYEKEGCCVKTKIYVNIIEPSTEAEQFPYISGYEDKTFRANQPVTREELATMIARLLTDNDVPDETNTIPDLNPNRYSTSAINYVRRLGLMSLYSDGTFRSKGPVTWTEFNDILKKLEPYVGLGKEIKTKTLGDVTRAEAVLVFNELFNRNCTDTTNIQNPYTDLKADDPAYQAILCASVSRQS
ncbi:S-layer homology domain-containing protein [Cellulosilyticum ruminicola]|uniref:S-layer homology domain-containing protein n=1 Tax=Cellulosilyticum ruminicola TaxID=425254 RepID=UPI0006D1155D|nr:S-layer homology domain-containing protein [Cellulosilyticum ruminicola]